MNQEVVADCWESRKRRSWFARRLPNITHLVYGKLRVSTRRISTRQDLLYQTDPAYIKIIHQSIPFFYLDFYWIIPLLATKITMKFSVLFSVFCASVASGMCIVRFDQDFPIPVDTTQPVGDFMCNHAELWLHKFSNGTVALESIDDNSIVQIIPDDSVFAQTAEDSGYLQSTDDDELEWAPA